MGFHRIDGPEKRSLPGPAVGAPSSAQPADGTTPGPGRGTEAPRSGPFALSLALAMGVGPMAVYALTALSPVITADMGLGRTAFGSLATMAFVVAAGCSTFGGRFIDRAGERTVLVMLFTGSCAALLLVATAPNYVWLLLAVAVSGAAQSLSNPVTNRLIATRLAPGRQGMVMGVKQSGVQLAQFTAGVTLPAATLVVGWRLALGLTAVLAVVGLAVAQATVPRAGTVRVATASLRASEPLPRVVWWLTGYLLLVGAGLQATNVYVPLYAFEELGLSATAAGATTAMMGGVGLLARFGYGRLAERMQRPRGFLLTLAALAGIGTVLLMGPARHAPSLVWVGAALHGLTALAANVVAMMAVVTLVPARQVGAATGIMAMGMYVGFAIGPVAFGGLADRTDQYLAGWLFVLVLYGLATALALLWARRDVAPPLATHTPDHQSRSPRRTGTC